MFEHRPPHQEDRSNASSMFYEHPDKRSVDNQTNEYKYTKKPPPVSEGPLTTSLNATGETQEDSTSAINEDAIIGLPYSPRAQLPSIDSNSDEPKPKRPKKYDNDDFYNGKLLGPMEPMKIAKANPTYPPTSNNHPVHSLDLGDPEISPADLPNIKGFPIVDQSVPSISEDSRLASIINNPKFSPTVQTSVPSVPVQPVYNDYIPSVVMVNPTNQFQTTYAYDDYNYQQRPRPSDTPSEKVPVYPIMPMQSGASPLSFMPNYDNVFPPNRQQQQQQQPMTTTAYPVLFQPMPMNQVQMQQQPALFPMNPPDQHLQPHTSAAQQAFPGLIHSNNTQPNAGSRTTNTQPSNRKKSNENEPTTSRTSPPANTPDRIFKCTHPGCDWSFARSSDQKRHIRSHQKPSLKCPFWELEPNCNRKGAMFYRLDVLKRHLRLVHLKRNSDASSDGGICRLCSRQFSNSRDFLEHCEKCADAALAQKGRLNDSSK